MPLIATPISNLFENDKDALKLFEMSDCLEVRQRSLHCKLEKQWLFHIDIDLTQYWDKEIQEYLFFAISQKKELQLVTFQATRCCVGEDLVNGMFQLSGAVLSREQLLQNAKENVAWFKKTFGLSIKCGFENNNYYPTPAYEIVTDADFIRELVEVNNIYFLLDVAHAMVTAHNRKISYHNYLSGLPLSRVIQIHICQPLIKTGLMALDAHEVPNKTMLEEIKRLVKHCSKVQFLTIEYYKDVDLLLDSIKRLKLALNE